MSTLDITATPEYLIAPPLGRLGPGSDANTGPSASSLTPSQIQSYYGANQIMFGSIHGNGAGQTIAIVDAYDNPDIVDSFNGVVTSGDLYTFDNQFGLNNNITLTKYGETGSTTTLPAANAGWAGEEALDVEWSHVMAPDANIDLVEATTQNFGTDMIAAIKEAASLPGVSVVSMSFGYPEVPKELNFNAAFTTPAGHQGVTFVSATSDTGSMGAGYVVDPYSGKPAFLPNVISVGGTSLYAENGAPTLEAAWNQGGGGISKYIQEPSYQEGVQTTGMRTAPDVSMDADLYHGGVAVYDPYTAQAYGYPTDWLQVGGTSLATPMWAALIADANQGRVLDGGTTLGSGTGPNASIETLTALYSLPSYDFNDIVAGDNEGNGATSGYDMVTGLGTPRANVLVPDLAAFDLSSQPKANVQVTVTTQPPTTVDPGQTFGLSAAVQDQFGDTDAGFNGAATLTSSLGGKRDHGPRRERRRGVRRVDPGRRPVGDLHGLGQRRRVALHGHHRHGPWRLQHRAPGFGEALSRAQLREPRRGAASGLHGQRPEHHDLPRVGHLRPDRPGRPAAGDPEQFRRRQDDHDRRRGDQQHGHRAEPGPGVEQQHLRDPRDDRPAAPGQHPQPRNRGRRGDGRRRRQRGRGRRPAGRRGFGGAIAGGAGARRGRRRPRRGRDDRETEAGGRSRHRRPGRRGRRPLRRRGHAQPGRRRVPE